MKICLLADGQSVHVQQLVSGLVRRGVEVHILTHKPAVLAGATVERFRVPNAGLANPRRWSARRERYLRGFFRRFDLVNIHFLHDWGLTPEIMDRGCLVASAWGSDIVPPPGETPPDAGLVASRVDLLRRATAVTACGPTFARTVADFAGIDHDRVDVLPFGVDLSRFHGRVDRRSDQSTACRVGFFKGFRDVYGPIMLIRAIPFVLEHHPRTRFELIGDGPRLADCKALAVELRVDDSIEWIPKTPHHEISKWLARWDVSVIPSVCEAFGVAALESSAMHVPIVASNVGGLPDTIRHEQTGLLVEAGRPEELARGIGALLDDAPLRRRMGDAGRAMVERDFDWADLHDRWIAFYERTMDRAGVIV